MRSRALSVQNQPPLGASGLLCLPACLLTFDVGPDAHWLLHSSFELSALKGQRCVHDWLFRCSGGSGCPVPALGPAALSGTPASQSVVGHVQVSPAINN